MEEESWRVKNGEKMSNPSKTTYCKRSRRRSALAFRRKPATKKERARLRRLVRRKGTDYLII